MSSEGWPALESNAELEESEEMFLREGSLDERRRRSVLNWLNSE